MCLTNTSNLGGSAWSADERVAAAVEETRREIAAYRLATRAAVSASPKANSPNSSAASNPTCHSFNNDHDNQQRRVPLAFHRELD